MLISSLLLNKVSESLPNVKFYPMLKSTPITLGITGWSVSQNKSLYTTGSKMLISLLIFGQNSSSSYINNCI